MNVEMNGFTYTKKHLTLFFVAQILFVLTLGIMSINLLRNISNDLKYENTYIKQNGIVESVQCVKESSHSKGKPFQSFYKNVITYSFSVNGQEYIGKYTIRNNEYSVGDTLEIRYNMGNPIENVGPIDYTTYIINGFGVIIALALACCMTYSCTKLSRQFKLKERELGVQ